MIERLHSVIDRWQCAIPMAPVSTLFVRTIYLIALLIFVALIPIASQVWGPDYVIILRDNPSGLDRFAQLLQIPAWRAHYQWFLYPCMALLFAGVVGYSNFVTRLIVWFLIVNLHMANMDVSNSGWHVLRNLMLLSVFFFQVPEQARGSLASALRLMHNVAFRFTWVQIALLYFTAGVSKLFGHMWLDGQAMAIVLAQGEFSHPLVFQSLLRNTWYLKLGTWLTLLYQLSFPVLIWFRATRSYLLWAGLIFHLGIVFIVGLADFGFILIASYTIFLPAETAERILQAISKKPKIMNPKV